MYVCIYVRQGLGSQHLNLTYCLGSRRDTSFSLYQTSRSEGPNGGSWIQKLKPRSEHLVRTVRWVPSRQRLGSAPGSPREVCWFQRGRIGLTRLVGWVPCKQVLKPAYLAMAGGLVSLFTRRCMWGSNGEGGVMSISP